VNLGLALGSAQALLMPASLGSGGSEMSTSRFLALAAGPKANAPASTKGERSLPNTGGVELWLGALGLALLLCGIAVTLGAQRKLLLKR
jgi:LPXTG-motif cell wall-anchored protein